jgi:hypothetical protein
MARFITALLAIVVASAGPALAQSWSVAIEQNVMETPCNGHNISVGAANSCATAIPAAQSLFSTEITDGCLSQCPSGSTSQWTCTPQTYTVNGHPRIHYQVTQTCQACTYNHDFSTGIASWTVNGNPAYDTTAYPGWAITHPGTTPFPAGTHWIQPKAGGVPVFMPGGTYIYKLIFRIPQCALNASNQVQISGWFAADNAATLKIDNNTAVPCNGPPNYCFQPANVTPFTQTITGIGPHTVVITVTNASNSPSGLVAHITVP